MRLIACITLAAMSFAAAPGPNPATDWAHYVRIAGHGLSHQSIPSIIDESQKTHVFGIEVDNDIPGRYESFLDPTEKLEAIRQAAKAAHAVGNKAFVYIAGLECITAHGDQSPHTFFKDHPDWVQRDRAGKPAVFGGGTAFWITKGDEDVWVSPYAPEWRSRYMQRVRQIASTGIDGVYVDIPYWMTHFEGWEKTWASFDRYTVAAFRSETGIDALHDMRLGDSSDPHFRRWIDFRIATISAFMREIDKNVKQVNPNCLTIAEIYPGYEHAAPQVGADVYELYQNVDVIAHEYQGPADSMGASRSPFAWIEQLIGMFTFRAFAGDKPTWMLNYSWDGEKDVSIPEAMKTLFASQLTAGANTWDAQGHVMSGSNDMAVRTETFTWIAKHEHTFYDLREPISPVGVYFSPKARNHFSDEYVPRFRSAMELLLFDHREFQILTPRTLSSFHGALILVPGESLFEEGERQSLSANAPKSARQLNPDTQLTGFEDRMRKLLDLHAAGTDSSTEPDQEVAHASSFVPAAETIRIQASPFVASQIARVHGRTHVFLMNFKGIIAKHNLLPQPDTQTEIQFSSSEGTQAYFLPFLGEPSKLSATHVGNKLQVRVPAFERNAVIWLEP